MHDPALFLCLLEAREEGGGDVLSEQSGKLRGRPRGLVARVALIGIILGSQRDDVGAAGLVGEASVASFFSFDECVCHSPVA